MTPKRQRTATMRKLHTKSKRSFSVLETHLRKFRDSGSSGSSAGLVGTMQEPRWAANSRPAQVFFDAELEVDPQGLFLLAVYCLEKFGSLPR